MSEAGSRQRREDAAAEGDPGSDRERPGGGSDTRALLGWIGGGYEGSPFVRDTSREVEERLARRLLLPPGTAALGLVLGLAGVAAIGWGRLRPSVLGSWMASIAVSGVVGDLYLRWIGNRGGDVWDIVRGTRRALLVFGLVWGGGFALVAPGFGLERLLLLTLFLGGLGVTVAMALSADPPSFRRFGVPAVAGLLVGVLRHGRSDIHWLTAASVVLFVLLTVALHRRIHRSLRSEVEAVVELERHESQLEGERGFLAALLQSLPDAIVAMERDGRVLGVNQGFHDTFGWTPLEVLGRDLYELVVPEEERQEARSEIRRILEEGADVRDVERVARDGTRIPVRILAAPVEDDEDVIVVLYSDISDQKETEEALERAKERAEEANRAKSEFLATMSHEIRTPMNAIIGMAELLDDTDLSPTQEEYVDIFRTAGDTLLSLIDQILDLSKIEADRLDLDERPFEVSDLVEQTVQLFGVPAHQKGVELAARIDPEVDRWVVGDADRLRQVLVNLVGNAVKFTEEGEIVLRASEGEKPDGWPADRIPVRFEVRDTGPGIPEERKEAIFERFTQADSSTTREHGGTGLGLTISNALVDLMGGELGLESEVGVGSTFHFTVPLSRTEPDEEEAEGTGPAAVDGLRVLVVDDNATNRLILREMLTGWGADARTAARGWRALEELKRAAGKGSPYDLVLVDGQMPGIDGFEVAERIRDDDDLSRTALVILTSSGRPVPEAKRAEDVGVDAHLVKPVRRAELGESVRFVLGGPRAGEAGESAEEEAGAERAYRILLVEDTAENRMLVERYLAETAHVVHSVERGREAVDAYTDDWRAFDLILMDIQMPGMDGYEATERIRAWEEEHGVERVPIAALTAHALEEERQRSAEAGCDAHVAKPIKKEKLTQAIDDHARKRGPRRADGGGPENDDGEGAS